MKKSEWAGKSWNPVTGCSPISEACDHCYARRMSRRLAGRFGYPKDDPFEVTLHRDKLDERKKKPSTWQKPRRVFTVSMGDLFHDKVPFCWIDDVMREIVSSPRHTFIMLTKRPERMKQYFSQDPRMYEAPKWPLPNLWLGVTCENQQRADQRIPTLLQIPAAVRFVSIEPMLGPVDLVAAGGLSAIDGRRSPAKGLPHLDWVIVGGETGTAKSRRPMRAGWVRNLVKQCKSSSVPIFVKTYPVRKKLSKRTDEWPAYARLWQFP